MQDISRRDALAALGVVLLSGCGGGDSPTPPTGATPPPPPPSPPAPPPPPPPPAEVGSFGTLGATSTAEFAVIGTTVRGVGSGWDFIPSAAGYNTHPAIKMRVEPPTGRFLTLPDLGEGELVPAADIGDPMAEGQRVSARFSVFESTVDLYRPIIVHSVLQYVMRAYFVSAPDNSRPDPYLLADFMYGSPSPAGALPASGTGTYRTTSSESDRLLADFAARTMSGTIAVWGGPEGTKGELREVVVAPDGIRFAGKIVLTDAREGTIEGYFLGPDGQEIMARLEYPSTGSTGGSPNLQNVVGLREP